MLFAILPSTVDAQSAASVDMEFGIEVSGEWGGKWRASCKGRQVRGQARNQQLRRLQGCLQL